MHETKSDILKSNSHAKTACDAEGSNAVLGSALLHLVDEGGGNTGTGTAERMSESDSAAVYVDDIHLVLKTELLDAAQRLRCECFVELPQTDVVLGDTHGGEELVKQVVDCCYGAKTHYSGIYAACTACYDLSQRLETESFCLLCCHDYECGCTVVTAGCVACGGNCAFVLLNGLELCHLLKNCIALGIFVYGEYDRILLLLRNYYRNDLIIETAGIDCCYCSLLALECKLIAVFSADVESSCYFVSGPDHAELAVLVIGLAVRLALNVRIAELSGTVAAAETYIAYIERCGAHALYAAAENYVRITALDLKHTGYDCLHAGCALAMYGVCGCLYGNVTDKRRKSCDVGLIGRLLCVSADYFVDVFLLDAGLSIAPLRAMERRVSGCTFLRVPPMEPIGVLTADTTTTSLILSTSFKLLTISKASNTNRYSFTLHVITSEDFCKMKLAGAIITLRNN